VRRTILLIGDGESVHVERLAIGIAEAGWNVHLARFEGQVISGVTTHQIGRLPPSHDIRYGLAVPALARLVRRIRPRIVHAHYVTSYGVLARAALALANQGREQPRLIISAWGSDLLVTSFSRPMKWPIGWALRGSDLVVGDSEDLEERAAGLAPNVPWHRFVYGPERRLIEAPLGDGRDIVSARSLIPEMRIDLVIRAFRHLSERTPSVATGHRLIVAGDGPLRSALEDEARGLNVEFTGRIERAALHEHLLRSRVQVSIPTSDATSAALMDGLAAGMVPVVNDLPANREWVDQSIGEVVSRAPGIEDVADALARALTRPIDRAAIRDRVRQVVWEDELKRLLAKYDELN
jgi:glycosyltransferase involved in cell wall biosynthesis